MTVKTTAEKLQIKPDSALCALPADRLGLLGPLPAGVRVVEDVAEAATAVLFADDAASARALLSAHDAGLAAPKVLWVAYPKGGLADINRDTLWPIVAEHDLRPNGQAAIDATWSALRFRANKPGEAPFSPAGAR
jgi:hypothetical protein